MTSKDEIKALAEAHCDYLITVFRKAFIDGFIHGYKHGQKDIDWKEAHEQGFVEG